jgi:hypothetical protein
MTADIPPLPPRLCVPQSPMFPRVVIESPLRGSVPAWVPLWLAPLAERFGRWRNRQYARACMLDSLRRHEAPYASHLLMDQPGILDDAIEEQRGWGIDVGVRWGEAGDLRAVYCDRGISGGMEQGVLSAPAAQRIVYRWLYERRVPHVAERVQRVRARLEAKRGRN